MEKAGFLCIGKIAGVHGIRGNLKVYSYVESPSVYESGSRILLEDAAGGKKFYEMSYKQGLRPGLLNFDPHYLL